MVFTDETFLKCVKEDDNGEKMQISVPLGIHMVRTQVQLHSLLISSLHKGEWSASHVVCFNPTENPCYSVIWLSRQVSTLEKRGSLSY